MLSLSNINFIFILCLVLGFTKVMSAPNPDKPSSIDQDSTETQTRKSSLYIGFQFGAQFAEFSNQKLLTDDLNVLIAQKYTADTLSASGDTTLNVTKSKILQPYDPVQVIFPVGVLLGYSLFENLYFFYCS